MTNNLAQSRYDEVIQALHYNSDGTKKWVPHPQQTSVIRSLFQLDHKFIFVQCGRKWGKTETLIYCLIRWALLRPDQRIYYLAPWQKQAREIVWESNRVLDMIPKEFIAHVDNKDMRVTLDNGSFLKMDGSDNYAIYRGINPHLVGLEEFADFDERLAEHMFPNLRAYDAPVVIIGTPPSVLYLENDIPVQYLKMARRATREMKAGSGLYLHGSTLDNPHLNRAGILKERDELIADNEEDIWKREYLAEFCEISKGSIFPMLSETEHRVDHDKLISDLKADKWNDLEFHCLFDPGTTSCFAVLFAAYNREANEFYLLDELYIKEQHLTVSDHVWPLSLDMMTALNPDPAWRLYYDEAAASFYQEINTGYGVSLTPTHKSGFKQERGELKPGIRMLKSLLRKAKIKASTRCKNWWWEMRNYKIDTNTKGNAVIPKKNDHLIDLTRYMAFIVGYSLEETRVITKKEPIIYMGNRIHKPGKLEYPGPVGTQELEDMPYDFD